MAGLPYGEDLTDSSRIDLAAVQRGFALIPFRTFSTSITPLFPRASMCSAAVDRSSQ